MTGPARRRLTPYAKGIHKPSASPARGSRLEEDLKDWTVWKDSIFQHSEPPAGYPGQPAQRAGLQTVSGLEGLREAKATEGGSQAGRDTGEVEKREAS